MTARKTFVKTLDHKKTHKYRAENPFVFNRPWTRPPNLAKFVFAISGAFNGLEGKKQVPIPSDSDKVWTKRTYV
jgi:hypothetical protein